MKKEILYSIIGVAIAYCVLGFFNKALAVGLLLLLALSAATMFGMVKAGLKDKKVYILFLIALAVHLAAVLFIYYGHFKPFGGGADYEGYNQIAIELASRFSHGNFSLAGLYTNHFFPILIGAIYMITVPAMIVGQLFTVWLAALSIVLVYLLVREVGGTQKTALLAGLLVSIYPSYLYFGSILLKDTLVAPFVLAGMLVIIKMAKHFSWVKFLIFFILLTCLINLRFYIGYALMLSFIVSWPLLSAFPLKKKVTYWIMMVVLLGFSSKIVGNGYYGFNSFKEHLNEESITYYREVVYSVNSPLMQPQPVQPTVLPNPPEQNPVPSATSAASSTFVVETGFGKGPIIFLKNSLQSFTYSLFGPFPWQFTHKRQVVGLAETLPWYMLIIISVYAGIKFVKKRGWREFLIFHKFAFPVLLFTVFALGALSLFINNYGIIARIRIPMFMSFISIMFISFSNKDYEKIFTHWRRWVHWIPFIRSSAKSGQ